MDASFLSTSRTHRKLQQWTTGDWGAEIGGENCRPFRIHRPSWGPRCCQCLPFPRRERVGGGGGGEGGGTSMLPAPQRHHDPCHREAFPCSTQLAFLSARTCALKTVAARSASRRSLLTSSLIRRGRSFFRRAPPAPHAASLRFR